MLGEAGDAASTCDGHMTSMSRLHSPVFHTWPCLPATVLLIAAMMIMFLVVLLLVVAVLLRYDMLLAFTALAYCVCACLVCMHLLAAYRVIVAIAVCFCVQLLQRY